MKHSIERRQAAAAAPAAVCAVLKYNSVDHGVWTMLSGKCMCRCGPCLSWCQGHAACCRSEVMAGAPATQVLQLGQSLSAQTLSSALPPSAQRRGQNGAAEQQTHAFWGTQPVAQFGDDPSAWVSCCKTGPRVQLVQRGHCAAVCMRCVPLWA